MPQQASRSPTNLAAPPRTAGNGLVWSAWTQPTTSVSAPALNAAASKPSQWQATVAGEGALIPLVYGRQPVGAKIAAARIYQGRLILLAVWCLGEVDSVVSVAVDNKTMNPAIGVTHYTGTSTQGVDPWLAAAISGYADTLHGVCYSVFRIPQGTSDGFPRLTATIRGKKIATTSGGAKSFQDNPAYILADFIENTTYGMGRAVDWATVATLATACDTDCAGERKRILNLVMDQSQKGEAWLQSLRDYAGAWVAPEGDSYRLIADVPGTSVMSFDQTNIAAKTLKLRKRGTSNMPTVVQCDYTNTATTPHSIGSAFAYAPGVLEGTTPRRVSRIAKPGITRHSEANRYAIERLNESLLCDLAVNFVAFDEALALQVGEIVDITHPIGLADKLVRVMKVDPQAPGRWTIAATEYDPAKYSTTVQDGPSVIDTELPSPTAPPAVQLASPPVEEEVYQVQTGLFASRLRITWDGPVTPYPFTAGYNIEVSQNGLLIESGTSTSLSYVTKALTENMLYTVSVALVSSLGVAGAWSTATFTNNGKLAVPSDVTSLDGYEVGGDVHLSWVPSVDLDLTAHEIRYSSTSDTWEDATLVDRVSAPATRYSTKVIPEGTWRFWIKGLDSIRTSTVDALGRGPFYFGQESVNAVYQDILVTSDANAFIAVDQDYSGSPTLSNMTACLEYDGTVAWITDFAQTWTSLFPGGVAMSTYTNPLASYHSAGTSSLVTAAIDHGALISGDWHVTGDYDDISGTAALEVELSDNGSSWTNMGGPRGKGTARYSRARYTTTGTMKVYTLGHIRVDVVSRSEAGMVMTSAAGPVTVTLAGHYFKAVSVRASPQGTAAGSATVDNIVVSTTTTNSFDVYRFNNAGTKIAELTSWDFQGV